MEEEQESPPDFPPTQGEISAAGETDENSTKNAETSGTGSENEVAKGDNNGQEQVSSLIVTFLNSEFKFRFISL